MSIERSCMINSILECQQYAYITYSSSDNKRYKGIDAWTVRLPATWAVGLSALGSRHVWPRPTFLRCERDQARFLDPARAADAQHRAELERGADRPAADRALRRQGSHAQPRGDALGPHPLLGQGHQDRLLGPPCEGRGGRHQAGLPRSIPAPTLPGAARRLLRMD